MRGHKRLQNPRTLAEDVDACLSGVRRELRQAGKEPKPDLHAILNGDRSALSEAEQRAAREIRKLFAARRWMGSNVHLEYVWRRVDQPDVPDEVEALLARAPTDGVGAAPTPVARREEGDRCGECSSLGQYCQACATRDAAFGAEATVSVAAPLREPLRTIARELADPESDAGRFRGRLLAMDGDDDADDSSDDESGDGERAAAADPNEHYDSESDGDAGIDDAWYTNDFWEKNHLTYIYSIQRDDETKFCRVLPDAIYGTPSRKRDDHVWVAFCAKRTGGPGWRIHENRQTTVATRGELVPTWNLAPSLKTWIDRYLRTRIDALYQIPNLLRSGGAIPVHPQLPEPVGGPLGDAAWFVAIVRKACLFSAPASRAWRRQLEALEASALANNIYGLVYAADRLVALARSGAVRAPAPPKPIEDTPPVERTMLSRAATQERWWKRSARGAPFVSRDYSQRALLFFENTLGRGHADAPRTHALASWALGLEPVVVDLKRHGASARPRALYANGLGRSPERYLCDCAKKSRARRARAGDGCYCRRDCPFSLYSVLGLDTTDAPEDDRRVRFRCITTKTTSFLTNKPHHGSLEKPNEQKALQLVNSILQDEQAPRRVDGEWTKGGLKNRTRVWTSLVDVCNFVPGGVDTRGCAVYRLLSPDDAAAMLGHELDARGRAPTAWLRDTLRSGVPFGTPSKIRAAELRAIGSSYSPLTLLAHLPEFVASSSRFGLRRGPARPLWSFCCGIGSELPVLKFAGARLSAIHAFDTDAVARHTFALRALRHFPDVPVEFDADLLDAGARHAWSHEAICKRLDAEGVPLIFCGWPCAGHAGANRHGHGRQCFDNPSSALLLPISRILGSVERWLDAH